MGQRTIDTILRVQGEQEYKTALKNCSAEMKVMKSELDKVTSDYRTNANSMEALTKKGEVLSKMYDAQKQKVEILRGAMSKAEETRDAEEKTVADLRARYEQAQKALKTYGDELGETSDEYHQQKAEVDKLRDSVIQHQTKLDASTRSYQSYSVQLNKAEVDLNSLSDKQDENNRLLDEAKKSADNCATSIDRYGDAVKDASDGTGKASSAVESMAGALVASGILQKVQDIAAAMMECSEAAQTFEHSVNQVSTISDGSVMSKGQMQEGILGLSTELRKDANEVADAAYNALSAGVDTAGVMDFVRQSAQLSTAGFTDMGTSVDVLTTILNAYGLEASHTEKIASTLVATQNLGKITVADLGKVLGRIIPSAAAYKVNLDNVSTAYARMTASGINAENTTTYLSTMLDELSDSGSNVAAILKDKTGKTFADLMEDGRSLGDVLDILGASVDYDNTQFSNLWASATAAKGAVALFNGGADAFNATLTQMANSSGTVAKNYEQMTTASEYSSQRLKVATDNLKIAVGSQLNPTLDKLRETGAGVLEIATDFINDNPAVVSAISGVATAVGLLGGGLSALMIAKSVAKAMQALNITMLSHPAVLIATGIAGLVSALAVYNAQIESDKEKVDALTESARALNETVADGQTHYSDTVVSAEAAYSTVQEYIERLESLEKQGLKTDTQQQEYAITLEKINTLMPGINAEIDDQTGLVEGGTAALLDQAEAWKKNAIEEAAYARYKDDIAAMVDAEYELAKNQAMLNIAIEDGKKTVEQYNALERALTENLQKQRLAMQGATLGYESSAVALSELQYGEDRLRKKMMDVSHQISTEEYERSLLTQAIEKSNQAIADNAVQVQAAEDAYFALTRQTTETTDEVVDSSEKMAESSEKMVEVVGPNLQELREAYEELYASAKDSLENQIGLFDAVSTKCEMSTEDMLKNLQSQMTAFYGYSDNIHKAIDRGINIGLVQQLSDGSVQSMQILAALVAATDEEIANINSAFDQTQTAKENAARTMALFAEAFGDGVDQLSEDWKTAWIIMGQNAADGLIYGLKTKKPAVSSAAGNLAESAIHSYKTVSMINSPSKRWMWLAEQEVAAPLQVYRKAVPKFEAQAKELSDAGYLGAVRSKQAAIPSMVSAASSVTAGADNSRLYQLLQQILLSVQAGKRLVIYPDVLVGQTVGQYDEALGQQKFLSDRGAR